MLTEAERHVLALLRGGQALSEERKRAIINELGAEELDALRRIAAGEIDPEHPKLRLKAIAAIGLDEQESDTSRQLLVDLAQAPEPRVALQAIRALGRSKLEREIGAVRALIRDASTHPAVALAAARIAATQGQLDVVDDLQSLRARLLALVENPRSPSIASLDRLIAEARGEVIREDGPRPVV